VQPMLTFFMGRSPSPVESLAVFPVVHALSFLFSALGLSFQEAAIALLGRQCEHARPIARFGAGLALAASGGLALVAFTPLATTWFETVSGLSPELASVALTPARVVVLLPALSVILAFERAVLVQRRTTGPITAATAIEVAAIASLFPLFGWVVGMTGVTAAVLAFTGGRLASVGFLLRHAVRAIRG
jgi:progressive ankylosis protein